MKQRVIFWGSVILAVGGIVCAAFCMSAEGGGNIALWIAALVLIALGVIGLSLTRYGDSKRRPAKYEREREEERAAPMRAQSTFPFCTAAEKSAWAPPRRRIPFSSNCI